MDTLLQDLRHALAHRLAQPGVLSSRGGRTGSWHRRKHRDLLGRRYRPSQTPALSGTEPPGARFSTHRRKDQGRERHRPNSTTGAGRPLSFRTCRPIVSASSTSPKAIPSRLRRHMSAPTFFRLFGAPDVAGRTFTDDEDRPGGGRVVVLSEGFWKRRFGGDSSAVGRAISLNGEPHEVIGVLGPFDAEAVQGPTGPPDLFLPFQIDPNSTMQGHFFIERRPPQAGRHARGRQRAPATRCQRISRHLSQCHGPAGRLRR